VSFSRAALEAVACIVEAAAVAEIMPRFRRLLAADIRAKNGPLDIVTEADEAAERRIEADLRRRFPGCTVVGEEATSADASLLGHLADAELAFVVDPIDGTSNYASGLPLFGSMVGVLVRGEVVGAVIHDPMGQDTAFALRGEGAWIRAGSSTTELRVAAAVPLAEMAGAASWRFLAEPLRSTICRNLPRVAASFQYRCAAHEYRLVAGGHCHYLLYGRLLPWDHAAGWLLHREAGGYSARFDDTPYRATVTQGGLICAPDRASWEALRAALLEG
jgi:fructose-1,6-bisphosphatase/inositol monophosphatase family enzyme